jgi:hypothetical protein
MYPLINRHIGLHLESSSKDSSFEIYINPKKRFFETASLACLQVRYYEATKIGRHMKST